MFRITLLPGDGIGPEVLAQARKVLEAVAQRYDHEFSFVEEDIGGAAIDRHGQPLPAGTVESCLESDAVLMGAVGGPRWDSLGGDVRPEAGLLGIRKALGTYANLRPVKLYPFLGNASPLRSSVLSEGVDLLIVRELTGGLYFGSPKARYPLEAGGTRAVDTMEYSDGEIRRIARTAFELAAGRRRKVTSVDKANVLECSRLWREVVEGVSSDYPGVELEHILVDNFAMQLIRRPSQFDVVVTENTFGDILSDLAAVLSGSIGMLPSASLGEGRRGLYEPVHGSAPDIAGRDIANPIGAILSAAMMLRCSLGLAMEADAVEGSVEEVLSEGYRTRDIISEGQSPVSCSEMGQLIVQKLLRGGGSQLESRDIP